MSFKKYPPVELPPYTPWVEDPAKLIEEERLEREKAFWAVGIDHGYNGKEKEDV